MFSFQRGVMTNQNLRDKTLAAKVNGTFKDFF